MTWETFPCCCAQVAPGCPDWTACIPNAISVELSLVCRIVERWNGIVKTNSEWSVSATASFEKRQVQSGSPYLQLLQGQFSWSAIAERYSFHGSTSAPEPCYPCGSSYLSVRSVSSNIVNRPVLTSQGSPSFGVQGTELTCYRCPNSGSPALSKMDFLFGGPFDWTDYGYSETGSLIAVTYRSSSVPRFASIISTKTGCLDATSFRRYAVNAFGSVNDPATNSSGLAPAFDPWWFLTGAKNCNNQDKSFGPCFDAGGNPIASPVPLMSWDVTSCPDEIYDTHACYGTFPPIECGTSIYFPPYNLNGVVDRTIREQVTSAFQITSIS